MTSDLAGTWLRVGVQGVWRGAEGREFMRFEPDGRFTWGMTGRLTSPYRALRGHYLDVAGTVTVTVDTMSLCSAADRYTWRATLSRGNRLHLAHPAGMPIPCGSVTTAVWSARRLPRDHPLAPAARPSRGATRASYSRAMTLPVTDSTRSRPCPAFRC